MSKAWDRKGFWIPWGHGDHIGVTRFSIVVMRRTQLACTPSSSRRRIYRQQRQHIQLVLKVRYCSVVSATRDAKRMLQACILAKGSETA